MHFSFFFFSFLATLFDNMVIGDEVKYDFLLCRDYSAAGVVNDRSRRGRERTFLRTFLFSRKHTAEDYIMRRFLLLAGLIS